MIVIGNIIIIVIINQLFLYYIQFPYIPALLIQFLQSCCVIVANADRTAISMPFCPLVSSLFLPWKTVPLWDCSLVNKGVDSER